MKIIQVIPFFGMGGAEIMCENLVYELKKLGHEVIVVSLYSKETVITQRLKAAAVDVRFLDKKSGFDFSMYKKLKTLFRQEKPDVIHTHLHITKYVFPVAAKLGIRVVHTIHSVADHEAKNISKLLNKHYYKRSKAIPVALSESVRETIKRAYKLPKEKIPVIFNGIDLGKCDPKTDYLTEGRFKIVHVGSFLPVKNHKGLLNAFEIFHRKFPDSELYLVGDGTERDEIERLVKQKNLNDCVFFTGIQPNVFGILHSMDMFTLTSIKEGIPMSIAEAMGTGLPIVATAVGGVPDMLDENSAQLVEVNESEIAEAFEKYYSDYELRKKHGENALKLSERFSAKNMAENYCDIYRGM